MNHLSFLHILLIDDSVTTLLLLPEVLCITPMNGLLQSTIKNFNYHWNVFSALQATMTSSKIFCLKIGKSWANSI